MEFTQCRGLIAGPLHRLSSAVSMHGEKQSSHAVVVQALHTLPTMDGSEACHWRKSGRGEGHRMYMDMNPVISNHCIGEWRGSGHSHSETMDASWLWIEGKYHPLTLRSCLHNAPLFGSVLYK